MKIIFFGTPQFAAYVLEKLLESNLEIVAIVTRPDKLKGRHLQFASPEVKETALRLCPQIPLYQPLKASTPEFAEILKQHQADLFIVVAYGEIIKQFILDIPKICCVNVHASLLPKFRGAAPMQRSLMAGEKQTGITLIEMALKMDAGDMLAMEAIAIDENMTRGELQEKLCNLSVKLLLQLIKDFKSGSVTKKVQDHSLATFATKIEVSDEKIDWNRSATEIHNQIRALSPLPGAWCLIRLGDAIKRLKIKKSQLFPEMHGTPGEMLRFDKKQGWLLACSQGAIQLLEVQLEGKKSMSAEEFVRGCSQPLSIILE